MSYDVYTAEYTGKPNHVAIYIETNPNALQVADRGRLYHVTGNILQGMRYDPRGSRDPIESASFVPGTKKRIGTIAKDDLARFEAECCKAIPPPPAQMTLGGKRLAPPSRFTVAENGLRMSRKWRSREAFSNAS